VWKCPGCEQSVDDDFDICWKCQTPRPAAPEMIEEEQEPALRTARQPDGSVTISAFGRALRCAVCSNVNFRRSTAIFNSGSMLFAKSAVNFTCTRCGHLLWFAPPK